MLLSWATVLVLTGIDDNPQGYSEIALQRACACEAIARRKRQARPELAYVAGLFSLLDSMLQLPTDQVAATLPLPNEVIQALEDRGGNLGGILAAVVAYENGDSAGHDLQDAFWDGVSYARRMLGQIESG
jgi:EAL and modified HD-GYP domain-containing signal transduction protein